MGTSVQISEDLSTHVLQSVQSGIQRATSDVSQIEPWRISPGHLLEHLYPHQWRFVKHLELLNLAIVQCIETGGKLIVEMPVRHGKSEICTFGTPLWLLDRWPERNVIVASHAQKFAAKFGRRVRNAIQEHHRTLSIRLAPDISSASEWQTTRDGGMLSVGVEGSLTGRGTDLLIIDDPISNWKDANSIQKRDAIWDWWDTTASTRVEPGGAVIIVMARWHPDDLVGRLKSEEWNPDFYEDWKVLNMPAIAEEGKPDAMGRRPGQALWPERWSARVLRKIEKKSNRSWNALYQQHPRKTEGNMFDRSWFEVYEKAPDGCKWLRAWDLASSKKQMKKADPDYTVGGLVGFKDGQFYLDDVVRMRGTPKEVKDRIKEIAREDARRFGKRIPIWFWQDPGQAGVDQIDTYKRDVLPGFVVKSKAATENKIDYADTPSDAAQSGNFFVRSRPWKKAYLDEVEDFPNGTHDDQVDMTSLAVIGHTEGASESSRRAPRSAGRKNSAFRRRGSMRRAA